jgi:hypothetical protein
MQSSKCSECYNDPNWVFWRDLPLNPEIKKKLTVQPPRMYYPSIHAALQAWGQDITEEDLND